MLIDLLKDLPSWLGDLILLSVGSAGTLTIQWVSRALKPWGSDRARFRSIATAVDAVSLNDLAESIPTAVQGYASDAAHQLEQALVRIEQERFLDRKLRRQEQELRAALDALLAFQGENFFAKHPHADLYTMAFDNHDEWNPDHARLLQKKSDMHRELAKAVLTKWIPMNERGQRLFVGKVGEAPGKITTDEGTI